MHAGERQRPRHEPAAVPIYQTAPFAFDSSAALDAGFHQPDQQALYTRYGNPSLRVVEEKLAALEGAEDAIAFASGMAAITATLSTVLHSGDRLLAAADLYGGTSGWLEWLVERHPDVGIDRVPLDELVERLEAGPAAGTKLVYLETPTNPLLRTCDLKQVGELCRRHALPWMIDNTFATPILQRPIEHGASYVVHSATKYLAGHSDLVAGLVAGSHDDLEPVRRTLRLSGGCLDPHAAFLLARGMRTLALRVERQSSTAAHLAATLAAHPGVDAVYYPGDDPVARHQMSAGGAMLSFEVAGGLETASKLLDALRLFRLMASLGGVESSAVLPAVTSHKGLTAEARAALGIRDGLVRLSVGIESPEDLEADLLQALERSAA